GCAKAPLRRRQRERFDVAMTDHTASGQPQFERLRSIEFEPASCPVCGANDGKEAFVKLYHGYHVRFCTCPHCDALYTNPRISKESLPNLYASEEFFEGKDNSINYYSFLAGERYLSMTAKTRLKQIGKYAKGKKMLEVASAAGFFLNQAKLA